MTIQSLSTCDKVKRDKGAIGWICMARYEMDVGWIGAIYKPTKVYTVIE